MSKPFLVLLLIILTAFYPSFAANMCGRIYPIIEPDMLTEMQKQADKILHDEGKMLKLKKRLEKYVKQYAPTYLASAYLSPAKKSYTYLHDVIYTLPFNIPLVKNGKVVGILYPKGFTFHVLRYVPYFSPLVVFDIKNRLQREYVVKRFGKDYNYKLISVSGNLMDLLKLIKELKRPVYFNLPQINERFALKNTISIVKRSEKYIDDVEVTVIGMDDIKKYLQKYKKQYNK